MENQINIGDKNTLQVGKNPAGQPVEIQGKPKVNYWMISTILLLVILLGWSGFYALNAGQQLKSQQATTEPPVKNTPTQQPITTEPIKTGNLKPLINQIWIIFSICTLWELTVAKKHTLERFFLMSPRKKQF